MPTRAKPYKVIESEKKSHRTKKELEARKEKEESAMSGRMLKERPEVASNDKAHREFLRLKKNLSGIEKWDDIYGAVINRYCQMMAECMELEEMKDEFRERLKKLDEKYDSMKKPDDYINFSDYLKNCERIQAHIISLDKQIQNKRKDLFSIEKENYMTIYSAVRNVPKPDSNPEEDAVLRVLRKKG